MERTIEDVFETLKNAKDRGKKCSVLIGAGCSVSAGIPTATDFVEIIKERYPRKYERSTKTYSSCMAELSHDERRDLILEFVNKDIVNWGHLALAQLMRADYVDRILTTNFDSIMIRACALLGDFPAIYDVAASREFIPSKALDRSIIFLHGQQTGFRLLNTQNEFSEYYGVLAPVFENAADRVWLVVGYSGENDPVFDRIANISRFDNSLFWIGYNDNEPAEHIVKKLLIESKDAFWVKGFDADTFFVNLARRLDCFPPDFVRKPFTYMQNRFSLLTSYVPPKTGKFVDDIDLMAYSKNYLDFVIEFMEPAQTKSVDMLELIFEERQVEAIKIFEEFKKDKKYKGRIPLEIMSAGYQAYFTYGNRIRDEACNLDGTNSDEMFYQAIKYYKIAVGISSERYEAHFDWGYALQKWAMMKVGEEREVILKQAAGKYQDTWKRLLKDPILFYDWGTVLSERARLISGKDAENLFVESFEKFSMSLELRTDTIHKLNVLYLWGLALHDFGKLKRIKGENTKEIFRAYL